MNRDRKTMVIYVGLVLLLALFVWYVFLRA